MQVWMSIYIKRSLGLNLLLCFLLATSQAFAQASIVNNGDFSNGFSSWSTQSPPTGSGSNTWVYGGSSRQRAELGWYGSEYLRSAPFTEGLVNGVQYQVTFDYGWNSLIGQSNQLLVSILYGSSSAVTGAGLTGGQLSFNAVNFNGSHSATLYFTPNANFATPFIRFTGTHGFVSLGTLWIDNVSVRRTVPEINSQTAGLPLFFLSGLLAIARERRRRAPV